MREHSIFFTGYNLCLEWDIHKTQNNFVVVVLLRVTYNIFTAKLFIVVATGVKRGLPTSVQSPL
jgi:hypothetical protein